MSMLKLSLPDNVGDQGNGYFGDLFLSLSGALYGAYTFGDEMMLAPGKDYSGNGRDLVASGSAAISGNYFASSATSYFDAPFNADTLLAHGTAGACSVIAIARHANAVTSLLASSYDTVGGGPLLTFGPYATTGKRVRATTATSPFNEVLIDATDNPANWEMVGATFAATQLKAQRMYTVLGSVTEVTAVTSGTRSGATPWRIGSHRGTVTTYSASSDIAAVGFYDRVITAAEFLTIFTQAKKHLAAYGVAT